MTASKIRALIFSIASTAVWLTLTYLVAFDEPSFRVVIGLILIGILMLIAAMGQCS